MASSVFAVFMVMYSPVQFWVDFAEVKTGGEMPAFGGKPKQG